jgi:hypothetical protein
MADGGGGGGAGLGVIVGALVVVIAIIGVVTFSNGFHTSKTVDVNIHAPAAPAVPAPK